MNVLHVFKGIHRNVGEKEKYYGELCFRFRMHLIFIVESVEKY